MTHFLVLLFLIDDVRLPIPTRFFSATAFAFCDLLIEPQVLGVLDEIRLLGLHFLVPLFLEEPHGFPFSSFHFSLNQRLSAAPLAVFLTAITSSSYLRPFSFGIWL